MTKGKLGYEIVCALTVASSFFVCIHGVRYDGDYGRTSSNFDRINAMMATDFLGSDSNDILGRILEDEAMLDKQLEIRKHPKLSEENRKFAVHPGYPSYYNPELRHVENEIDRQIEKLTAKEDVSNEEVAEDPFEPDEDETPAAASEDEKEAGIMKFKTKLGENVNLGMNNEDYQAIRDSILKEQKMNNVYFTAIAAVSSAVCVFLIVCAGICYYKLQKKVKSAEDVEYPAYGVTGPGKEISPTSGVDRKLAQNAQMYHYQHQKQQMIAIDSHKNGSSGRHRLASEEDSDEGEEGDYTVYECPGLAPTGEMEVRNPMFSDDQTTPKASHK